MFVLNCSAELRARLGLQVPRPLVLPNEPHIVVSCGRGQGCSAWLLDSVLAGEEAVRRKQRAWPRQPRRQI